MKRKLDQSRGALVWFRSDLRIHDNRALKEAAEYVHANISSSFPDSKLLACYVISLAELQQQNIACAKVDFILRTLEVLQKSLEGLGIPLLFSILDDDKTSAEYGEHLRSICLTHGLDAIFFNRECNPVAQKRDIEVLKVFDRDGIGYRDFSDQCIVPEGFVLTKTGQPYTVFTPFKNCWLNYLKEHPINLTTPPDSFPRNNMSSTAIPKIIPKFDPSKQVHLKIDKVQARFPPGEAEALSRLATFISSIGPTYDKTRNFPSIPGTSQLSAYLAIGAISPRTVLEQTRVANHSHLSSGSEGFTSFISELCWRDFYRHILHHFPHVGEGQPFKPEARNIEWREGPEARQDFERWASAQTGVPIVDAAICQLLETAWMHNRLRMIVSMYLTKHLLISWQQGEAFFAKHLIDYDFPSNNGGWQWSSSTGTDSQPYFRIFNPYTQSQNYDSSGAFIREYLPELSKVPDRAIHNPNGLLSEAELRRLCPKYPKTIVEHTFARNRALEVFNKAFKKL